jgi:dephospho-CoA kinase
MKLFGLTGGIGMGKSTAGKLLCELGAQVVDTDVIARQIVEPGQPALGELKAAFGEAVVAPDGTLKRQHLARRVFADPEARKLLEAILHPRIRAVWLSQVQMWRTEQHAIGIVVIPLLFEMNASSHFDATICAACSKPAQHERLHARGWSSEQIEQRCQAQWPAEKKMLFSDYVVWTEGDLRVHRNQLQRILGL